MVACDYLLWLFWGGCVAVSSKGVADVERGSVARLLSTVAVAKCQVSNQVVESEADFAAAEE